jgi:hypothetical protein
MNKKSSSFFRVDEQVFFTMGALCLLSLLIMAFRYGSSTPCLPVQITVKSRSLVANSIVRFDAATQGGRTFSWNFGDGTVKDEEISITNHEYTTAGKYTVTVLVNGQCSDMQDVVISEPEVIVNNSLMPMISTDPQDTAYVNQPVKFSDISSVSTKWEWRFGQTNIIDATEQSPTYIYTVPGRKTIILKVNDRNEMTVRYSLMIMDKPVEKTAAKPKIDYPHPQLPPLNISPQPHSDPLKPVPLEPKKEEVKEKPKAPKISADQLGSMLMEVADGKKHAEDFSDYLCGTLSVQVSLDGDLMPFSRMCEQLKHTKRIKRISALPTFNENNCVVSMAVTVKKKFL